MADHPLALVVGANRGLGLGLVRELLGRGYDVIATARSPDQAGELASVSAANPGRVTIERLDMNDLAALDGFGARVAGEVLDVLFVNAGVSGPAHKDGMQATPEEMGALMFTNAVAPIRLARHLLGNVREDSGVIAFMSSVMGSVADNIAGTSELYRASKAALNSMTRGFYNAGLGGRKITVLSLHPGWVRTDMGGPAAAVGIEESVKGLADVLEAQKGTHAHKFRDYRGEAIAW
jgi:NAD(P)-dependent dehydrogenase (short-subunit alcohol dehydrogenase family)